ncbi:unnamed protein product [Dibothriocephalus latus]|uniref:Uncharacterized protein n=1 Tax=Dibothriocephalus latus TaxID=60516 RepID=A0A3P7LDT2_DIBLA|nr:unnamed protein product [Dibothriocephalus latus]
MNLNEPIAPVPGKCPVWSQDPNEVFADLTDGAKVFIQGASSSPGTLVSLLYQHVMDKGLKNIRVKQFLPLGPLPYLNAEAKDNFRLATCYSSNLCRDAINSGRADFTPISVSEIPLLYRTKGVGSDYALIMVTPPDKHGFCSLGAAVGTVRSAIQNAKKIIGKSVDVLRPIILGFGRIPYEVTNQLRNHRDLGVHAEMFSDGIVNLVNLGVVNNRNKTVRRGRIVASYTIGTEKVFDFINENPLVALYDIAWVNSLEVIARNPKVTSVNTAFEMDLTGQCASDSVGDCIYTGVGGQIDYTRGASLSIDGLGRPIITMCSKNSAGQSSIVPFLTDGSGVVTTRAHVHYVVTEYGIAYLFGKNIRQRAHALIKIAHPDFR